jgi:hypothetical protein
VPYVTVGIIADVPVGAPWRVDRQESDDSAYLIDARYAQVFEAGLSINAYGPAGLEVLQQLDLALCAPGAAHTLLLDAALVILPLGGIRNLSVGGDTRYDIRYQRDATVRHIVYFDAQHERLTTLDLTGRMVGDNGLTFTQHVNAAQAIDDEVTP